MIQFDPIDLVGAAVMLHHKCTGLAGPVLMAHRAAQQSGAVAGQRRLLLAGAACRPIIHTASNIPCKHRMALTDAPGVRQA